MLKGWTTKQGKWMVFFPLCSHTCARPLPAPCCTAGQGVYSWGACHWCRTTGNRPQHGALLLHHKLRERKKKKTASVIGWPKKRRNACPNAWGVSTPTDLTLLAGEAAGFQSGMSGWECPTCVQSWAPFLPRGSYRTWDLPDPEHKENMAWQI